MTVYSVAPSKIKITTVGESLSAYEFRSKVAQHYFCNQCGIYTFHQTMSKPEHYRINIGCLSNVDAPAIPYEVYDGALI